VEFAAELEASLKEFSAPGLVEIRENGGHAAHLEGLSWEVRGQGQKPLLYIWSECYNLTVASSRLRTIPINVWRSLSNVSAG
jgi:hypothetical protein